MVADERRCRAEIEEELKELRMEKEALQSALRLIADEGNTSRLTSGDIVDDHVAPVAVQTIHSNTGSSHSRTSSQVAIKSRPQSLELALLYPLPSSPASRSEELAWQEELTYEETTSEGNGSLSLPTVLSQEIPQPIPRFQPPISDDLYVDASPWADAVLGSTSKESSNKPFLLAPASAR
jgi:hypothetical protein